MTLLTTQRLILELATKNDASFLYELMNDASYIENIGDRNINSIHDAENFITDKFLKSYSDNGYGYYIIKFKDSKIPIGICGLVNREELKVIDIGFALLPEFIQKGFAFEATNALYDYAKNTLKIEDIVAIADAKNKKSIALLGKLGLQFEKMVQLEDDPLECMLFSKAKH